MLQNIAFRIPGIGRVCKKNIENQLIDDLEAIIKKNVKTILVIYFLYIVFSDPFIPAMLQYVDGNSKLDVVGNYILLLVNNIMML